MRGAVLSREYVSKEDFDLLRVLDRPDEVVEAIRKWYTVHEVIGREALGR